MSEYREECERAKQERRSPIADMVKRGNQGKKKPGKKQRGEFKIRMTRGPRRGLEEPDTWIWNQYRDAVTVIGALRSLEKKYSFYFIEALDPAGKVIADNREAFEARKQRDVKLREQLVESPTFKVI